ncbi:MULTISPECIES: hypothetical protein [unclassified Fibrobacter]|uniref:hypothetical protein n=1 Tax=unclassified Fibrobacter TaxID=2634177 RepID=UPI000D6C5372|nr:MULTISPECIES: hypothetical protein [unclassified Fibrobacter]PWJ69038.1 hypothetical protein BGX12_1051 [Fibrobacter sp. UWR4]PZW72869.1 hypothetical protein C8E88_10051 [Fibrobacter sp. UWR1]
MGNNIGANSLKIKHELPPSLLGDAKEAQSISAEIFLTYESVLKKDSVWRRALTTGYQGRNIGIHIGYPEHVAEEIVPNIPINYNHAKSCSNWGCENKISGHNLLEFHQANEVARAVKNVAPKAQIYSTPNYFPEAPNTAQTPIYIGIPYLTNNDVNNYSNAKHDIDNYVYHNRVIEIAPAGEIYTWDNQNLYSQGLNVITVGAIDPSTTNYLIHNNIDRPTISNITSSRIDKPEIANFTNMFSPEDPMVNYVGYGTYTTYPAVYWTHGAAALTAGMVADLLQYKKFYQWHPEVVKALLISASSGKVNNANTFLKGNQRVSNIAGHYYPYFTDLYKYNRSQYWNGNNEDHFINEEIVLYEHHITSGRKYRIAIAWLSSGDYVRDFGIIPQDIDLEVCQDDRCYTSNSAKNPFEVVEFTAQTTGDLKVTIKRYNNEGGRVLLGYNLHEFVK